MISIGSYLLQNSKVNSGVYLENDIYLRFDLPNVYVNGFILDNSNLNLLNFSKYLSNWFIVNHNHPVHDLVLTFYYDLCKYLLNSKDWTIDECLTSEYNGFLIGNPGYCLTQYQYFLDKIRTKNFNFDIKEKLLKTQEYLSEILEKTINVNPNDNSKEINDLQEKLNKLQEEKSLLEKKKSSEWIRKPLENKIKDLENQLKNTTCELSLMNKKYLEIEEKFNLLQSKEKEYKQEVKLQRDNCVKISEKLKNVEKKFLMKEKELKKHQEENDSISKELERNLNELNRQLHFKNEYLISLAKEIEKVNEKNIKLSELSKKNMKELMLFKEKNTIESFILNLSFFKSDNYIEDLEMVYDAVKYLVSYELGCRLDSSLDNQIKYVETIVSDLQSKPNKNEFDNNLLLRWEKGQKIIDIIDPKKVKINKIMTFLHHSSDDEKLKVILPSFLRNFQILLYEKIDGI